MPYVDTSTAEIYYESHGEGPALLFAHGAGGNHAFWWQQVPHFNANHQVLTLDTTGGGLSRPKWGEYGAQDHPEQVYRVLQDAGVERAFLIGHGVGAMSCLRTAIDYPELVAGVVCANSIAGLNDVELKRMIGADRAQQNELPESERLLTKQYTEQQPEKTFLFQQLATFNPVDGSRIAEILSGFTSLDEARAAIASGLSLTFVLAERDQALSGATQDALKEKLPEADYQYVADAGYSFYWEQPTAFNALLDQILAGSRQAA
jgi:3-oxoadipate enol-lactonase